MVVPIRNVITDAFFLKYVMENNPCIESDIEPSTTTVLIKSLLSKDDNDIGPDFHKFLWSLSGDDNCMLGRIQKLIHV